MFNAKRPVLILGAGVRLAGAMDEAIAFAHRSGIPIAPTWAALDIMPHDDPLFIGSFGTHGTRYGNFSVQNADLILSVGSRLDTKSTGSPPSTFAPGARIIMVDIDPTEINKFQHLGLKVEGIVEDAKAFFNRVIPTLEAASYPEWYARIRSWKERYPQPKEPPYEFVNQLSELCMEGDIICCDTGCTVAWLAQAFKFKKDQRFIHAWNQTPMGYGIPAAIGAALASGRRVVVVSGDGSFMMQNELSTISNHDLNIKVIVINNGGHAMCRQTQREWFESEYHSTSWEGGLSFPDFSGIADASYMPVANSIEALFRFHGPIFYELCIPHNCEVTPKLFATKPLHDMQPYLSLEQLALEMNNEQS